MATKARRVASSNQETHCVSLKLLRARSLPRDRLNTPFDVVKSRMQNQLAVAAAEATGGVTRPKYTNVFQALGVVAREEGFRALYKGLGARLLRLGPGGGIMIVAFDQCMEWLQKIN